MACYENITNTLAKLNASFDRSASSSPSLRSFWCSYLSSSLSLLAFEVVVSKGQKLVPVVFPSFHYILHRSLYLVSRSVRLFKRIPVEQPAHTHSAYLGRFAHAHSPFLYFRSLSLLRQQHPSCFCFPEFISEVCVIISVIWYTMFCSRLTKLFSNSVHSPLLLPSRHEMSSYAVLHWWFFNTASRTLYLLQTVVSKIWLRDISDRIVFFSNGRFR